MTSAPIKRIFLVGMMGSGKTTIGRLVAARLRWAHLDSDTQVEKATGHTVSELFALYGEEGFRAHESEALALAASSQAPVVVSVAGGAVLSPSNRLLLSNSGKVIWLRAEVKTLVVRVRDGSGRPLLGGDPASALARLDEVRRPFYEEVADVTVDVDGLDREEVVNRVMTAIKQIS